MNNLPLNSAIVAAGLAFFAQAHAQALNDPAIHGMQVLPRVEGCNVPGGLQPITSSDGPNDAMFWCGAPPYCLTMTVGSPERCHIIPGSRNGGERGVRNPQDLRCDVSGAQPTGPTHAMPGRCPVPATPAPTVQVMFNPPNPTVNTSVQVRTLTSNATSLTWTCSGRWTNRNTVRAVGGWISSNHSVSGSPGTANCTFTAVGPGGSRSANASWTSVASGGGSGGGNDSQLPQSLPPLAFVITYTCGDIAFSRHLLARADYNSNGTVTVRSEPPTYVRTTTAMTYNWGSRAVSGGVAAWGGAANIRINVTSTHMTAAGGGYNRYSELCSSNP